MDVGFQSKRLRLDNQIGEIQICGNHLDGVIAIFSQVRRASFLLQRAFSLIWTTV